MRISGPNGSGKTTLLRTIAGIHKPIRGQIFWNLGEQQERKSTDRPKLAYIGHASGLRGELTAIENLQFYASIMRDQCVLSPLECLHKLGIEHCSALPCNQLSAGQRQRVALARLGLSRYDIWLLDEPITSLDDQGIELFVDLANNYLKAEGSVLYCSHQSLKLGLGRNSASIDLRDAQNKYSQC